jgi:hypothetical protein
MTSSPLTLRGTLSQLQRAVSKFYAHFQERFEGNVLVSGMWAAMGNELQLQVENLKKLPTSFWQSLKQQEKELANAAIINVPHVSEGSLRACLAQTLDIEEPLILRVYAPLIHQLRVNWTEHALDFYILVKSHIARLAQSVQLFSGDPALSLRCAVLLQNFEKEVQDTIAAEAFTPKPKQVKAPTPKAKDHSKPKEQAKAKAKKKPVRTLAISKRAKPLVGKIKISGRRAQR